MAGNNAALVMADRLCGGTLAEQIADYRKANVAWAAIARLLKQDHGVEVTPETLRAWAVKLGVEPQQAEAAS